MKNEINRALARHHAAVRQEINDLDPAGLADQLPAAPFTINENGFPDSDIVQLANASSDAEFASIASRLQEIKTHDEFAGLSTHDIIARIKPRLCQDPTELMKFVEYLDANVLEQPHIETETSETETETSSADTTQVD